jgi:DNA-binding transcriptional ArsR family regulator
MQTGPSIVAVAALIGDQARAAALTALMDGRALTATELADAAGVTRQTMSSHLAQLREAGLLAVEAQGRHRYFRLAGPEIAHLLESMMGLADATTHARTGPRDPALRRARVCYDHVAGELGVRIHDSLLRSGALTAGGDGLVLTPAGETLFTGLGIDTQALRAQKRVFCRACLDWSERRPHLAGSLGAALLARLFERDWVRRVRDSRVLAPTAPGLRELAALFPG